MTSSEDFLKRKEISGISELFDVIQIATVSKSQVALIYIYMGVSVYQSQIRVPIKDHIMCQTTVNLKPCSISHIARSFWYSGTKA